MTSFYMNTASAKVVCTAIRLCVIPISGLIESISIRVLTRPAISPVSELRETQLPSSELRRVTSMSGSRFSIIAFSIVVGLFGLWALIPELLRPHVLIDTQSADADITRAKWAARIGLVRGDLWAEYALATIGSRLTQGPPVEDPEANEAAKRAVRFAPHDARAWLVLGRLADDRTRSAMLLKMSYYTRPNELSIIAPRLILTAQLSGLPDPELNDLLEAEIRKIITQRPALAPAIAAAYRTASPEAKRVFESTLSELDPALLKNLQSSAPRF